MSEQDFKYYLDSLTVISIGAKYSYRELIREENISLKYRTICKRCFTAEVDPETTLESHLYYMKPEDESCDIYTRLKTKVIILEPELHGGHVRYAEKEMKIGELAGIPAEEKERRGIIIREVRISKMGLGSFAV